MATGTDYVGAKYGAAVDTCPGCGQTDSVAHKYMSCARSKKVWKMVLGAWNGLTGESLDHEDAKVVLLGLRRHQWERCGAAPDEGGAEGGTQEDGQ